MAQDQLYDVWVLSRYSVRAGTEEDARSLVESGVGDYSSSDLREIVQVGSQRPIVLPLSDLPFGQFTKGPGSSWLFRPIGEATGVPAPIPFDLLQPSIDLIDEEPSVVAWLIRWIRSWFHSSADSRSEKAGAVVSDAAEVDRTTPGFLLQARLLTERQPDSATSWARLARSELDCGNREEAAAAAHRVIEMVATEQDLGALVVASQVLADTDQSDVADLNGWRYCKKCKCEKERRRRGRLKGLSKS